MNQPATVNMNVATTKQATIIPIVTPPSALRTFAFPFPPEPEPPPPAPASPPAAAVPVGSAVPEDSGAAERWKNFSYWWKAIRGKATYLDFVEHVSD